MNNNGQSFMEVIRRNMQANNTGNSTPSYQNDSNSRQNYSYQEPGFSLSNGMMSSSGRPVRLASSMVG